MENTTEKGTRSKRQNRFDESARRVVDEYQKDESVFVGYDQFFFEAEIWYIIKDQQLKDEADEGDEATVILSKTPFYAESGGQVADNGLFVYGRL